MTDTDTKLAADTEQPTRHRLSPSDLGAALWGLGALLGVGLPLWFLILTVPGLERRWWILHRGLRLMTLLAGIHLDVQGEPPLAPHVVIVNHESYLDGGILIAASPQRLEIAVSAAIQRQKIPGPVLRRLGCVFVGDDNEPPRDQLARLSEAAHRGHLALFPEGHLVRGVELDRFRLGAFVAAASAGVPVLPVAIVGSRGILPPGEHRPRRGHIVVRFGEPIYPTGPTLRDARSLARTALTAIDELRKPETVLPA
jgi:1-acyl-sn-glycerol-3-phosphate acyltransferase